MLFRLNKRTVDVSVLRQTHFKRYARFVGIADSDRNRGFRHRNNYIGAQGVLLGKLDSEIPSNAVDRLPKKMAVRTGKIDELKNVHLRIRGRELFSAQTIFVNHNHFAGAYIAHKFCADGLESARFGRKNESAVYCGYRERAYPAFVANSNQFIFRHDEN